MALVALNEALDFDDVLIQSKFSEVRSRNDVDFTMKLFTRKKGHSLDLALPVIASPMLSVCESEMAFRLAQQGGIGIIHRFNTIEEQVEEISLARKKFGDFAWEVLGSLFDPEKDRFLVGAAIGANGDFIERLQELLKAGVDLVCIDIANGNSILMKEALSAVLKVVPDHIHLMTGNVLDFSGWKNNIEWGANSVRASIGGGRVCETSSTVAVGLPTFQALLNINLQIENENRNSDRFVESGLIADGGISKVSSIVKSFGAGATAVMLGGLLAGTKASPGSIIQQKDGRLLKEHIGSASEKAQKKAGKTRIRVEGVSDLIAYTGKIENLTNQIIDALSSACSYNNVKKLEDFSSHVVFQRVSKSVNRQVQTK